MVCGFHTLQHIQKKRPFIIRNSSAPFDSAKEVPTNVCTPKTRTDREDKLVRCTYCRLCEWTRQSWLGSCRRRLLCTLSNHHQTKHQALATHRHRLQSFLSYPSFSKPYSQQQKLLPIAFVDWNFFHKEFFKEKLIAPLKFDPILYLCFHSTKWEKYFLNLFTSRIRDYITFQATPRL